MSDPPFRYERGAIHLPELALWLDAHNPRPDGERVFVSHAHSDHTAAHHEIITTEATRRLMQVRVRGKRIEHTLPYGETREFSGPSGHYQITLLPAGHILGSAMSLVKWNGRALLYTGDFKLRPGLAAEICDPTPARGCDWLIMECTFGRRHYAFPPADEVRRQIVSFCAAAIDAGATAMLLGYSLGRAQELLCTFAGTGLPIAVHPTVDRITRAYAAMGWEFPEYQIVTDRPLPRAVIICPANAVKTVRPLISGEVRTAAVTGWAMDSECRFRNRADAAFPLSDHADHAELIEFVHRVNPRQIFTVHGFASEFAQTLRHLGFDARALSENDQLELAFGEHPIPAVTPP